MAGSALLLASACFVSAGRTLKQGKGVFKDGSWDTCLDSSDEIVHFGIVQGGRLHNQKHVVIALLDAASGDFLNVILFSKFGYNFPGRCSSP